MRKVALCFVHHRPDHLPIGLALAGRWPRGPHPTSRRLLPSLGELIAFPSKKEEPWLPQPEVPAAILVEKILTRIYLPTPGELPVEA